MALVFSQQDKHHRK